MSPCLASYFPSDSHKTRQKIAKNHKKITRISERGSGMEVSISCVCLWIVDRLGCASRIVSYTSVFLAPGQASKGHTEPPITSHHITRVSYESLPRSTPIHDFSISTAQRTHRSVLDCRSIDDRHLTYLPAFARIHPSTITRAQPLSRRLSSFRRPPSIAHVARIMSSPGINDIVLLIRRLFFPSFAPSTSSVRLSSSLFLLIARARRASVHPTRPHCTPLWGARAPCGRVGG